MDYSSANKELWNVIIQLGLISSAIMIAYFLRQKAAFIRKSLMPVAVLAGFMLLAVKYTGLVRIDTELMEVLVYHGIALGFIAMSLRVPPESAKNKGQLTALRSGAVIVSSYMVQGITGLLVTLFLGYTFMPRLFKASGLLLPMGYGQGPGQANNVGSTYEALGFAGGRSFGLAVAAAGYLVACIFGVVILNVWQKKGRVGTLRSSGGEKLGVDFFHGENEIPISDSIDKLSVQLAIVLPVYLLTFLAAKGITSLISALSPAAAASLNPLIWGFNFIIGSAIAILVRVLFEKCRRAGITEKQYQNNYLLNRISGFFFDLMITAGIASIRIEDINGLWAPFLLMTVLGGAVTVLHLRFVCKRVYPDYFCEGFISMFGMMTGTISSGVLLLREIDPDLSTPAANNLITGSSVGILFGAPVLLLVGLAPRSDAMCWLCLGLLAAYLLLLLIVILRPFAGKKAAEKPQ